MGPGTSGSEDWLRALKASAGPGELVSVLEAVSSHLEERFHARIWFAKVWGPRWSYIAGQTPNASERAAPSRIRLARDIGLVTDTWGSLPPKYRSALLAFLRSLVEARDGSQC